MKDDTLKIRLPKAKKALWKEQAIQTGLTLTDWIVVKCDGVPAGHYVTPYKDPEVEQAERTVAHEGSLVGPSPKPRAKTKPGSFNELPGYRRVTTLGSLLKK